MLFETIVVDNMIDKVDDVQQLSQKVWVEKTPDHVLKLDIVNNFYPKSKFVFVLRNPEQAILSRRKNFINESKLGIEVHTKRWLESINAIEEFQRKYPERVLIVKLEELAEEKEKILNVICGFLGIPFDASKIENYSALASDFVLPWEHWKRDVIQSKISKQIADNEKSLSDEDLKVFLKLTESKLKKYGYFSEKYKNFLIQNGLHVKDDNLDMLMEEFSNLISISALKNPIRKYKAYKNLLKVFHDFQ